MMVDWLQQLACSKPYNTQYLNYIFQTISVGMYKKPTQTTTTPNISLNRKTNKPAEKLQVLPDKRNETTNDFKIKDEQLLSLIKQHLQLAGYLRSYETLKGERPNLKAKVQVGPHQNRNLDAQKSSILQHFDKGSRQQFFKVSSKIWSGCDQTGKKLQFDLQVYFLIYNIHPNLKRHASLDQASANAFKRYLDTKADNLAYTKQDLALFAIPYTPEPQKNPAFAYLFTKDWITKIRGRLNDFIVNHYRNLSMSQQSSGMKKVSGLQEIFYNHSNTTVNTSREDFKQNCNHTIQMQALKQQNTQLRTIIENYHKKFEEFAESSKQNLLQSNQKWFIFSRQIFMIARRHIKQDKTKLLEKYASFFSGNVEEMIQANQISLFDKNSCMYEDLSMTPDISKQKIALKKQQSASVNTSCQLDFNKIKHLFLQANIRDKQIEICTVLKALKDRLNKSFNNAKRKQIIIEYSRGDICGINEENYIVQKRLLFDGTQRIRQFYVKLTEALTTTDVIGLQYLSKSKKLIQNLVGLFSSFVEESKCFKPVIGILQRLSFCREPRTLMIQLGIIPMIFKIFKNQGQHLSDFAIQFLTAMMMNLSLKPASRPDFQKHKSELISIVIQYLTSQNNQVRNHINGSLFLLLTSKQIKNQALKQKLDLIIKQLLQTRQDDMCSQQYAYILKRLNDEEDDLYKDEQSDEDNQEGEIQQYEQYEDEQYGSLSDSSDDCIEGEIQIANGQELLLKNYVLLGPEAVREQILTRSVLDQTSRRLNNMTTSINRSRRMDNIFVSIVNATVLQPELLDHILNKKK